MKKCFFTLLCSIFFLSFQCEEENQKVNQNVTSEVLAEKKQLIIDYIASVPCNGICKSIAFGVKPCGGPWEYLVYSSSLNETILENMVTEYNEMEQAFNIQTGAISDCMLVLPPSEMGCVNGQCIIIN